MSGEIGAVTLATLAPLPRWVAWQTEGRGPKGKPTKVPYNPVSGRKALADQPSTWGTRKQAEAGALHLPRPFDTGGIGLELGHYQEDRRPPYASPPIHADGGEAPEHVVDGKMPDFVGSASVQNPKTPMPPMPPVPRQEIRPN